MLSVLIPKIVLQTSFWVAQASPKSDKILQIAKAKPNKPVSNRYR